MDLFYLSCHGLLIPTYRIFNKLLTLPDPPDGVTALYLPYSSGKFHTDLFVGNTRPLGGFIIGQIPQMYQQRQHIIPVPERHQIVCKTFRVHFRLHAAHQLRNRPPQSVKVKVDVPHQTLCCRSLCPVRVKIIIADCLHDRTGIIYRYLIPERISIVPLFHHFKAAAVAFTKLSDLILCKTNIFCKLPGFDHGILQKIRYG